MGEKVAETPRCRRCSSKKDKSAAGWIGRMGWWEVSGGFFLCSLFLSFSCVIGRLLPCSPSFLYGHGRATSDRVALLLLLPPPRALLLPPAPSVPSSRWLFTPPFSSLGVSISFRPNARETKGPAFHTLSALGRSPLKDDPLNQKSSSWPGGPARRQGRWRRWRGRRGRGRGRSRGRRP